MSHLLHAFPLISLHELTPITDAYQWNAHDHLKYTTQFYRIKGGGDSGRPPTDNF